MATEERRKQWREFRYRNRAGMSPEELAAAKKARSDYDLEYRKRSAERRRKLRRAYQSKWNAMRRAKTAEFRAVNPRQPPQTWEQLAEKRRAYRASHHEDLLNRSRQYYLKNSERLKAYSLQRYRENPRAWMARNNKRTKERRKTDPAFRMILNVLNHCHRYLRGQLKSAKWEILFGCSASQFRAHLESLFQAGMSWENYGVHGWHVDHIVPLRSFDMSDPAQQKLGFNFRNRQPMWAIDNIRKSNKHAILLPE